MLQLKDGEKIILVIRKHWFVMARTVIVFFVLLFIPAVVLALLPALGQFLDISSLGPFINFLSALYLMMLLAFLYLTWMDYYLDMWIITNERIIDVEQFGLFSREISEIPISRVQDVTIEVHGIIETILKFGTIRIQTAGEREFSIHSAPRLYEAKDTILRYAKESSKSQITNHK